MSLPYLAEGLKLTCFRSLSGLCAVRVSLCLWRVLVLINLYIRLVLTMAVRPSVLIGPPAFRSIARVPRGFVCELGGYVTTRLPHGIQIMCGSLGVGSTPPARRNVPRGL